MPYPGLAYPHTAAMASPQMMPGYTAPRPAPATQPETQPQPAEPAYMREPPAKEEYADRPRRIAQTEKERDEQDEHHDPYSSTHPTSEQSSRVITPPAVLEE